uniref:Uncharacterized protein n=1 Tax=Arundo donax TaxID=35708 RepID=A0A0A9H2Y2_ARUDO
MLLPDDIIFTTTGYGTLNNKQTFENKGKKILRCYKTNLLQEHKNHPSAIHVYINKDLAYEIAKKLI